MEETVDRLIQWNKCIIMSRFFFKKNTKHKNGDCETLSLLCVYVQHSVFLNPTKLPHLHCTLKYLHTINKRLEQPEPILNTLSLLLEKKIKTTTTSTGIKLEEMLWTSLFCTCNHNSRT